MSDRSNFSLDLTEFDKRLLQMSAKADAIVKRALWEGAAALKKDADELSPRTPHLHGNLRGDTVRGVKAKGSSKVDKDIWPKITREDLGKGKLAVLVTYCAPYAARWHETDEAINWSEAGVGPKYLEAKMARQDLRDKYYRIIAEALKEGLRND